MTKAELQKSTLHVDRLIIFTVFGFYALSTVWIALSVGDPMKNNLLILALALAALVLLGRKIEHLQQVIADQQEYIEAGAHGRYQGEE